MPVDALGFHIIKKPLQSTRRMNGFFKLINAFSVLHGGDVGEQQ